MSAVLTLRQVGVQQPLDLVEHFEQRTSQVPADVVPGGTLPSRECQLVLAARTWPAWVGCRAATRRPTVTSGPKVRPSASSSPISEAGQVPPLRAGDDGLAQPAHLQTGQGPQNGHPARDWW